MPRKIDPLDQKLFSFNDFQELYLKKSSIKPFQNLVDLKNEAIRRSEELIKEDSNDYDDDIDQHY